MTLTDLIILKKEIKNSLEPALCTRVARHRRIFWNLIKPRWYLKSVSKHIRGGKLLRLTFTYSNCLRRLSDLRSRKDSHLPLRHYRCGELKIKTLQ